MIKTNKGFTLIELLVVIAIIAILAGLVLVRVGSASADARNAKRRSDLNQIRTAIEQARNASTPLVCDPTGVTFPVTISNNASVEAGTRYFRSGTFPSTFLSLQSTGDNYSTDPDTARSYVIQTGDAACNYTLRAVGEGTAGNIDVSN